MIESFYEFYIYNMWLVEIVYYVVFRYKKFYVSLLNAKVIRYYLVGVYTGGFSIMYRYSVVYSVRWWRMDICNFCI